MIKDGLYHFQLGFPQGLTLPSKGFLQLQYSAHAVKGSETHRYGMINLPAKVAFGACQLIEAEFQGGALAKVLVRVPYTETLDLVLAVKPNGFVKTVWLNESQDTHKTLNSGRYIKP